MPLIITATDFSAVAENAVNYACELAAADSANVIILHTYIFPAVFSDIPLPASLINDTQKDAEDHMSRLVAEKQRSYPQLTITGHVIYGNIIDALADYTGNNTGTWLTVVGNNNTGEYTSWPDNTLIDALKELKSPILAIPPGVTYKPVRKLCFAFDNKHEGNDAALTQLSALSIQLKAELHVLNAQPDGMNRDNIPDIDVAAQNILSHASPHYHISYGVPIDEAINDFIGKNNIDWLILMPRKH